MDIRVQSLWPVDFALSKVKVPEMDGNPIIL